MQLQSCGTNKVFALSTLDFHAATASGFALHRRACELTAAGDSLRARSFPGGLPMFDPEVDSSVL